VGVTREEIYIALKLATNQAVVVFLNEMVKIKTPSPFQIFFNEMVKTKTRRFNQQMVKFFTAPS